ncbi:MAG: hypothetical protein ACRD07_02320 [Acidimicrobiales bacterium]
MRVLLGSALLLALGTACGGDDEPVDAEMPTQTDPPSTPTTEAEPPLRRPKPPVPLTPTPPPIKPQSGPTDPGVREERPR